MQFTQHVCKMRIRLVLRLQGGSRRAMDDLNILSVRVDV